MTTVATEASRFVVAIPAFNEEARICSVIEKCLPHIKDVWVIDDGSVDQTGAISRQASAKVFRHEKNFGKGVAIRTALKEFAASEFDYLIFMDADGQHDPAYLRHFMTHVRVREVDLVIGNRMLSTASMPLVRRITNQFMSWIVSQLAGHEIRDSQCGFRLVSHRFAQEFVPTTSRFDLESEMIVQAGVRQLQISSLPISTIYEGQVSHIDPLADTIRFARLIVQYLSY